MKNLISVFVFGFALSVQAGDVAKLSAPDREALAKTMELLKNPDLSSADPANKHVMALAGQDEQSAREIYALASEIFEKLIAESDGDLIKAMTALETAKSNPAAFAAKLSPSQLYKLRGISKRLPASTNPKTRP